MILTTKNGNIKVFTENIEQMAISQLFRLGNSPLGKDAHIRIMPDVHFGKGCTIGTTMKITDKVCPNIVGVDIGCGVDLVKTDIDFSSCLELLDTIIRNSIPHGKSVHKDEVYFDFEQLYCWNEISPESQERARRAMGTLGGGNHFIEAYKDGYLCVHSGSRNIGLEVAKYYQGIAENTLKKHIEEERLQKLKSIDPSKREEWLRLNSEAVDKELSYITGENMLMYLHDIEIMQKFASENRLYMLNTIVNGLKGSILEHTSSVHNYIDTNDMILRKGAISAKQGEKLVIPLNMRDGLLVCIGKGNKDWNCSAPHGAGRLYSRSKAKEKFTVEEYENSMKNVYTTCVNKDTLDEAPFVYKDYTEIMKYIEPTVEIIDRLIPIYNFKAN